MVKTQGRLGEVATELFTDFPQRFAERRRLFALGQNGSRRELRLENFWAHKDFLILKFAGIDSISDAEPLVGCEIQIPRHERAELEPGAAYVGDMIGCAVTVSGPATGGVARQIGTLAEVQFGAGEAPLLIVRDEGKREFMIPLAEEFVRRMDLEARIIELALPERMLDLDAPLTSEEKERQKGK